jgi:murein DD-endopeptidase MepM/ murein hydrolase activator NlpD
LWVTAAARRSVASVRVFLLTILATLLAGFAASASAAVARGWMRPVDGPVLRPFAVGPDRFAAGQHRGADLGAAAGARVGAACAGRVSFAGRVPGGGRTVSVRCGRLVATYQHLGHVAVSRGQRLLPGAEIGTVGRARPSPHVHLGARRAETGAYIDPLTLIGGGPGPGVPLVPLARLRPRPLGPAPTRAAVRPFAVPAARPVTVPRAVVAGRLPWPVWLGVGLVALGLPLGGGLVVARRRRDERSAVARTAA